MASRRRLVLGQAAVAGKSNESTAIPLLLERLVLHGALVASAAIGTPNQIAQAIVERGGDHLLALNANRPATLKPATLKDVEAFFADPPAGIATCTTTDGDHGRIEVSRHAVGPRCRLAVPGPALPGRGGIPRPRHDRDGRGGDPARG